jgi:Icc-related predicted phosphoesterase
MRIVATSDTHFKTDPAKIPDGDVFIHAGDLMYSGQVSEWQDKLDWLGALPHKTKLLIPGNHDYYIRDYEGLAGAQLRRESGVKLVVFEDGITILPNRMTLLGLQFVTGLRGWAWNVEDADLMRKLHMLGDETPDIVVSHAPMWQRLDALKPDAVDYNRQPVGTWAYAQWFQSLSVKPKHWINGHIHESYGRDTHEGCEFYNVAMCDRNYDQTNPPMVIDV